MKLTIDAGNSRVKWRLTDKGAKIAQGAQPTSEVIEKAALSLSGVNEVEEARISCVAGQQVIEIIRTQLLNDFSVPIRIAQVSKNMGSLTCGYDDKQSLGIDRWLAVAASYSHYQQAIMVVDAGSAITADIVGPEGQHLGGFILPGLRLMHDALWKNTTDVRVVGSGLEERWLPGKNTQQSVSRGCLLAVSAAIEALAAQYPVRIILTGGDAKILKKAINLDAECHANLVLDGLLLDSISFDSVAE